MATRPAAPEAPTCPCGGGQLERCCAPLHQGADADTPEALMRSRYSAYVLSLESYLLHSWHPDTRPRQIEFDPNCRWLGLTVHQSNTDTDGETGYVHFTARYRVGGASAVRLREHSQFVRYQGRWVYLRAME